MNQDTHCKMVVIGLDGATFDLILPWVEAGQLPHFEQLLAQGAHARLRSTLHPISPQAWSTFITGKNAGKHGIFDFRVKPPGSYQFTLTHGGFRRGASLWQQLGQAGRHVIVANVPFTYPPEAVNGLMLSGFDAPRADETFCHPPDLYRQILEAVGEYYLHEMYPVGRHKAEYEAVLRAEINNRVQVSRYLLERYDWDFAMMVVNATDLVQHLFWADMEDPASPFKDVIFHTYQAVDAALDEWLTMLHAMHGDALNLVVMSDHGGGAIHKSVHINTWLSQQGWLVYRQSEAAGEHALRWVDRLRANAKRYLPRSVKDWLKQRMPGFRNRVESWLETSELDWSQTRAFASGDYGNIYINVKGREPDGLVEPGQEYEQLLDDITSALMALRDPDNGQPAVEKVHRRDELYHGPFTTLAPDLVVQWRDYAYFTTAAPAGPDGAIFGPPPSEDATEFEHSGTHRQDGILLALGPDIQPGALAQPAHIADLAPTILHTFGLPVPEDMDGQVLHTLFRQQRPVDYIASQAEAEPEQPFAGYSEAEDAEVRQRLKALGYLE